jgi:hypothetical protein
MSPTVVGAAFVMRNRHHSALKMFVPKHATDSRKYSFVDINRLLIIETYATDDTRNAPEHIFAANTTQLCIEYPLSEQPASMPRLGIHGIYQEHDHF